MRHRKTTKSLSRKKAVRQSLVKNLAASLILHERMETTLAKAKVVQPYVERIIARSRQADLKTRRYLIERLPTLNSVRKVLDVLGPRYKLRHGGYTSITKLGQRRGDGGQIALIKLVSTPNETVKSEAKEASSN